MEWFFYLYMPAGILISIWINSYLRGKNKPARLKKLTADKTWDDEWLAAEKRRHSISAIKPCPLYFIGDKEKKHPHDGYRWYCECGKTNTASILKMVDYGFEKHVTAEHEKALAAINRTK